MASYFPPIEDLPIFDNDVFDASNSETQTLTIVKANLLYLRKTVADTASALETFNAGILSSSINSLTPTTNMTIGANITSALLEFGSLMTSGIINIGTVASRSGHTNISSGTTTTGTVNIISGLTSTGTINLATGSGSAKVNIGSGTSSGAITIGNSLNVASFGCPLALTYNPSLIGSTQLGYNGIVPSNTTSAVGLTDTPVMEIILPIGVWQLQAQVIFNLSANGPIYAGISLTSPLVDNLCVSSTTAVGTAYSFISLQRTVRVTTASPISTYYLTCRGVTTVTSLLTKSFVATRIG